jgi:hypothetical protein
MTTAVSQMNRFKSGLECVSHVVAILGILIGLYQYLEYKESVKVERTVEYGRLLFDQSFFDSWKALELGLNDEKAISFIRNNSKVPGKVISRYLINKAKRNESHFFRLLYLFSEINSCLKHSVCLESAITPTVKMKASQFMSNYQEFICLYIGKKSKRQIYRV